MKEGDQRYFRSLLNGLVLSLVLLSFPIAAQDVRTFHFIRDDGSGALDDHARKAITELVTGLDEKALTSFDAGRAKVRIGDHISADQLLTSINALGIGTFSPTGNDPFPEGFPQKGYTGDPATDTALYEQAKQQWIEAHPEEYERMIGNDAIPDD